jgi:hypothetical protein
LLDGFVSLPSSFRVDATDDSVVCYVQLTLEYMLLIATCP